MKKRSKLFLLVAGIIFAAGIVICLVGVGVSASEGSQLYAAKLGDGRGYTYEFGDGKTDKITISVTDADINVYGNSESSYIEVINFNENLCSYSGNDAIITFREASEVKDITGIWDSGLSFKGLRYVLRPVVKEKPKTVNIYLEKTAVVKALDIELDRGNVTVSDLDTVSDYEVIIESGKVKLSNISTDSSVKITASGDKSTDISLSRVKADIVKIGAKRAKFIAEKLQSKDCELKIATGSALFDFVPMTEQYTVKVMTKSKLMVDGTEYHDFYKYPAEDAPNDAADKDPTDEDGENEAVSQLIVEGSDLSVTLDTPETDGSGQEENTEE